jgi:DMSO/TMAO reductase YedYZ molybdopterin-dependent catalytic subunit
MSTFTRLVLSLALAWSVFPTQAEEVSAHDQFVTHSIAVSGAVEHPLNLNVAALQSLPQVAGGDLPLVCQSGANVGRIEHYKGVTLKEILNRAVVHSESHNDVKKMAIIARASDGYAVVFSWSEVFNSPIGEEVVVFFERDGQPLGADEGEIAMVSGKDTRTGPRHVKWLQTIEVKKIVE